MKKVFKGIVASSLSALFLIMTLTTVSAYSGSWQSSTYFDLNGVSTVYTTYINGGGNAETFTLSVKRPGGSVTGSKTVGASEDQFIEHTCWGNVGDKYGLVEPKNGKAIAHSPGFDE